MYKVKGETISSKNLLEKQGMLYEKQKTHASSFNEINGLVLDQDKQFYDLLNIHIKSLSEIEPILIDFQSELHHFLQANLLKPFESQQIKMKYINVILEPRIIKLLKSCFWYILFTRFPETIEISLQEQVQSFYKRKLSRTYVKLFQSLSQPKDEIINYIIFTLAYLIHFSFYKYFPPQRDFFDFRFILNCYHIILFEFNGLFVSDIYVKSHIEKFFTHKFLEYEKKNRKELLQKQIEIKKLNNKNFLGFNLSFPDINQTKDGEMFKEKVGNLFKKDRNKQIQQQLEREQNIDKDNKIKAQNRSKMHTNVVDKSGYFCINNSSLQGGEQDQLFSNLKMNCYQVSPTIGKLLEYDDLNPPFAKKKMIKHVLQKCEDNQTDLLNQMKQMFQDQGQPINKKKEQKINLKGKTLIDQYNLRAPPKEFYSKHQSFGKYYKCMVDLNYVLSQNEQKASNLPSSIEILKIFNNKLLTKINREQEEKQLKDKLDNQQKQMEILSNLKKQSGNQELLDKPFNGSREEGRKLIQQIRSKFRKELEDMDQFKQLQSEQEKQGIDYRKQRMKEEEIQESQSYIGTQVQLPPITSNQSKDTILEKQNTISESFELTNRKTSTQQGIFNDRQSAAFKDISLSTAFTNKLDSSQKQFNLETELPVQLLEKQKTDDSLENHRRIQSRVMQKEESTKPAHHGNLPSYILERALDSDILYDDKRMEYKQKYNKILQKISIDSNINELCHNILQKRNLMSHGLKKKSHH